jgi:hypothetical protein
LPPSKAKKMAPGVSWRLPEAGIVPSAVTSGPVCVPFQVNSNPAAEALEAYDVARRTLVDGLGIEPSRDLRELHQAILNQDPTVDLVAARSERAETTRGIFVGREAELAALIAGLDDAIAGRGRLFLLVGEPGIGKSRLAEEPRPPTPGHQNQRAWVLHLDRRDEVDRPCSRMPPREC